MRSLENKGYPHPTVLTESGDKFNAGKSKTDIVPENQVRIIYDNYGLDGEEGKRYEAMLTKKEKFWTPSRMEMRENLLKKIPFITEDEIEVQILSMEAENHGIEF